MTVDVQMHDLIMAKWAAQRAVQDREAQNHSVEVILEEAALANAQLAVAKAVLTDLKLPADATPEQRQEAERAAQELRREITSKLIFGSLPAFARAKPKRQPRQRVAVQIAALPGMTPADKPAQPPLQTPAAGQVVQLAFF